MPDLVHSLQDHDLGYFHIVAELWGLELDAPDQRTALPRLVASLVDPGIIGEMVATLPGDARLALDELLRNHGRQPWSRFTRRFGSVREMGPGRRDREKPHNSPVSPAEILWYRALLARAFFDTPAGPEEFAYIPDNLIPLLPQPEGASETPPGRKAIPSEYTHRLPASDRILDDACSLLAALRLDLSPGAIAQAASQWKTPLNVLQALLAAAQLLDEGGAPLPEPVRLFLEASRGEALAQLAQAWLTSSELSDLHLVPGLLFEGEWRNDPLQTRRTLLAYLAHIPPGAWWNLNAFVSSIRQINPDYQRPAGDYDTWFIREQRTGEFLRGFEHWDKVDGALIHFMITGPLYWLGFLDLAAPGPASRTGEYNIAAFRHSRWSAALFRSEAPSGLPVENEAIQANADGSLHLPRLVPRAVRYQVARFSAWEGEHNHGYAYRLTPASLERARQEGLRFDHLVALLRRHTPAIPPSLVTALERWEKHGSQARLERHLVLRLSSPELLQELRSSRAGRFLGDPLGPTVVVVKPGAWRKVLAVLAEMGYLGEADIEAPNFREERA